MIYHTLAHYYDALVKDEEATMAWVDLIETYMPKGKVMELACGSGEITIELAKRGYSMFASDLSLDMIEAAKQKAGSERIQWKCMDMCVFDDAQTYDGVLCLCDSFNYVLKEDQIIAMFQHVYDHLHQGGVFIMDMHSLDRLDEFLEEYNEAGSVDGREYQWTIFREEDCIYQNFAFYDEEGRTELEQHIQRVYDPLYIDRVLKTCGFQTVIITDFTQAGICPGEKQFFICRKEQ